MGIQWLGITTTINMLKSIFFVAALVAAVHAEAEADADADAYYSTLGYHGLGYSNYGFRSYAAPAYGYRSYGYAAPYTYGAYRHFGKRSAEAEAEPEADADAAYYSSLGYTNYGYNGYRSYVAPAYTRSFGYASPYAYNYGAYHHFGKRSADAEPEADADAAYYSTLGYHGLGYSNYGFNGYRSYAAAPAYSYGVRSYGYASPYTYGRYFY